MSRIWIVAVCALLTLVGGAVGEDATARPSVSAVQSAEDRIEAVLDRPLKAPLDFIETPLVDVVAQLQEEYEIPILFDRAALDEVAISPNTELSISISHVTLRSALDLMLREPGLEDLTYIIDKEVLLITTEDRANETLLTKVYRVDDFEHFDYPNKPSDETKLCYNPVPLIKALVNSVEFDSWMKNGTGEGSIFLMKPGMLVVSQTRSVHRKIEEFLTKLRAVKTEIEADTRGGGF